MKASRKQILAAGIVLLLATAACTMPWARTPTPTEAPPEDKTGGATPAVTQAVQLPQVPAAPGEAVEPHGQGTFETLAVQVTSQPLPPSRLLAPPAASSSNITPGSTVQHLVAPGDWLLQIARCYGASYKAVRDANNLYNPNVIRVGTSIKVPNVGSEGPIAGPPCVTTYKVRSGDTWNSLAAHYDTTAAILQNANPGALVAGRKIYVPAMPATQSAGPVPVLSHDLLFLMAETEGNDLARWRRADGQLEIYTDPAVIFAFNTNGAGNPVLLLQSGATLDQQVINVVDWARGVQVIGQAAIPAGSADQMDSGSLLVSPDGRFGAYAYSVGQNQVVTSFPSEDPGINWRFTEQRQVGVNQAWAPRLFPGEDADHFLLFDDYGIRQFDYALEAGEQILLSQPPEEWGSFRYEPVSWSPVGRYLLVTGSGIEDFGYFILDAEQPALVELPESSGYTTRAAATWLPDGTVMVVSPQEAGSAAPKMSIYTPQGSAAGLTVEPAAEGTLSAAAGSLAMGVTTLDAPALQVDGGKAWLVLLAAGAERSGIWYLDTASDTLYQSNPALAGFGRFFWVPDLSGLMHMQFAADGGWSQALYYPTGAAGSYDLNQFAPNQLMFNFQWVKP